MEIINPHKVISRPVDTENMMEMERVYKVTAEMSDLCKEGHGRYQYGMAISHCQVTQNDPLRFVVTNEEEVVINPEIIKHTEFIGDFEEGCLSFPDKKMIIAKRWNKVTAKYFVIDLDKNDGLITEMQQNIGGLDAKIIQHEIDHMNGLNIYERFEPQTS